MVPSALATVAPAPPHARWVLRGLGGALVLTGVVLAAVALSRTGAWAPVLARLGVAAFGWGPLVGAVTGVIEARRAVRARLVSLERQWAEGYRADKIEAVTVLEGLAAQMILLEAERVAADMILVFNRRRSPLHRLLHGSVAQQVVSAARIPVVAMPIVDAEPSATTTENAAIE